MAQAVDFPGTNYTMKAPAGDEICNDMRIFFNGGQIVSCWELSDDEIREVIASRRIYVAIEGRAMPPIYAASESPMRAMVADRGVWKK